MSRKSHVQTSKNVFTRHELPEFRLTTSDQALLEEYSANLKSFIALCRLRGVTPVLMTQANRLEGDTLYDQFNERIREIGQQEGITVIDLEAHIPKEPQYLYDSYHYTALGAQKAAELITPKLQAFIAE